MVMTPPLSGTLCRQSKTQIEGIYVKLISIFNYLQVIEEVELISKSR